MLFFISILLVLGNGASRPPQEIFQNDPGDQGMMDSVLDIVVVAIALLLFVGVISREPSRWFRKTSHQKKCCIHCLQCGGKRKPKEELKSQLPLVKELPVQENEHVEMEEVQQIQGEMDMSGNQDFGYKEQEEDLKDREKVLLTEKEKPKEGKHKLLKNEGNLKRREKLVKERQQKLKEKDMELKLKKDLWQKKEEERKKRQEELQKDKHEVKHCDKNEQERKGKDLLGIRNYEGRKRAKRQAHFQVENSQLFVGGNPTNTPYEKTKLFVRKRRSGNKKKKQSKKVKEWEREEVEISPGKEEHTVIDQVLNKPFKDLDEPTVQNALWKLNPKKQEEEGQLLKKKEKLFFKKQQKQQRHAVNKSVEIEVTPLRMRQKPHREGSFQQKQNVVDWLPPKLEPQHHDELQQQKRYSVVLQQQLNPHREGRFQQKQNVVDWLQPKLEPQHHDELQQQKQYSVVLQQQLNPHRDDSLQHQQHKQHIVEGLMEKQKPHCDHRQLQQQKQHDVQGPQHTQELQQAPQKRRSFPPPPPHMKPSNQLEQEEVVVLAAGYEDTMFGSGSIITPSYKLSKNLKRNIRLLQMADPRLFK